MRYFTFILHTSLQSQVWILQLLHVQFRPATLQAPVTATVLNKIGLFVSYLEAS